jgi:hypothetical protein
MVLDGGREAPARPPKLRVERRPFLAPKVAIFGVLFTGPQLVVCNWKGAFPSPLVSRGLLGQYTMYASVKILLNNVFLYNEATVEGTELKPSRAPPILDYFRVAWDSNTRR